jgi:hypothetical protein|tara:strand:+ start:696 stop:1187 length:492 start_codon:yes stop_codon:yes gene_type:complete
MKQKKGSIFDVLMLAIIIFAFSLFIVFGYKIMSEIDTAIQDNADLSDTSKSHMADLKGKYVNLWDGIFITVLILVGLAIAVGVYYFEVHPVFYVASIFIVIFVVFISAAFSNVFSDVKETEEFSSTTSEFSLLPFVMDNYVKFILFLSFIIIIVMYAKSRSDI